MITRYSRTGKGALAKSTPQQRCRADCLWTAAILVVAVNTFALVVARLK